MNSDVLAIIAADTHLSEYTWTSRLSILGDSFYGFKQLVDLSVKNKVPLILAGDCWELMRDQRPSAETVSFVRSQLDRLKEADQQLYYINGQHDAQASPYWFDAIHDSVRHIGNKRFKLGDYYCYGIDFFPPSQLPVVCGDVPADTYLLLMHQAWVEFTAGGQYASASFGMLPQVPLVVTGDMHKFLHVTLGGRMCVSPGATHMRTMKEPTQHFALAFMSNGALAPLAIQSRSVFYYQIHDLVGWTTDVEELYVKCKVTYDDCISRGYPPDVAKPLVIVDELVPACAEQILKARFEDFHVVVRDRVQTAELGEAIKEYRGPVCSIEDLVSREMAKMGLTQDQMDIVNALSKGQDILKTLGLVDAQ